MPPELNSCPVSSSSQLGDLGLPWENHRAVKNQRRWGWRQPRTSRRPRPQNGAVACVVWPAVMAHKPSGFWLPKPEKFHIFCVVLGEKLSMLPPLAQQRIVTHMFKLVPCLLGERLFLYSCPRHSEPTTEPRRPLTHLFPCPHTCSHSPCPILAPEAKALPWVHAPGKSSFCSFPCCQSRQVNPGKT